MFVWCVSLPPALYASRMTAMPVIAMYAMVQALDMVKTAIGFMLVKRGSWLSNIVVDGGRK